MAGQMRQISWHFLLHLLYGSQISIAHSILFYVSLWRSCNSFRTKKLECFKNTNNINFFSKRPIFYTCLNRRPWPNRMRLEPFQINKVDKTKETATEKLLLSILTNFSKKNFSDINRQKSDKKSVIFILICLNWDLKVSWHCFKERLERVEDF